MRRLFVLTVGLLLIVASLVGFQKLFVLPQPDDALLSASGALVGTVQSSVSSLNLIVRVSSLLTKMPKSVSGAGALSSSQRGGAYTAYESKELMRGRSAVLFFARFSDPFSDAHDLLIRSLVADGQLAHPVYRIDFATATGAKIEYGVVVPDTFVVIDAAGMRSKPLIHPTDEELRAVLSIDTTSRRE